MPFLLQPGLAYRPAPGVNALEHMRTLRAYLWNKSNGLCALCRLPIDIDAVHADHIVPRSKGGADGVHNLQAAHELCNIRKGDRTVDVVTPVEPPSPKPSPKPYADPVDKCVTIPEIARYVSVGEGAVKKWLVSGEMIGMFLGKDIGWRVHESEVVKFLDRRQGIHNCPAVADEP